MLSVAEQVVENVEFGLIGRANARGIVRVQRHFVDTSVFSVGSNRIDGGYYIASGNRLPFLPLNTQANNNDFHT